MKAIKDTIKVKVNIRPGPASLAQRAAWSRFWQCLIGKEHTDAKG